MDDKTQMKIYLLSDNDDMINSWYMYFMNAKNVEIVCDDFGNFMNNSDVECIVSPANSFGLMDGGYDLAITEYFGDELQQKVQKYIIDNFYGEQPVGSSFFIKTNIKGKTLIHTPTMRIPEVITDVGVIYHCMRSCLITAKQNDVKSIVIPAFGAGTGFVKCTDVAKMMWMGYKQIISEPKSISWEHAVETHFREV